MIHRLRRRQLGDRRHDAEGVGGQEDDVLRMTGTARARGVRDEVERIGRAGVLGLGAVVIVGHARDRIEHHVLQHGAEAVGGVPDHRLGFLAELDALGVAAALEIEDAVRTPAVLVVADQDAVRVGGQRGLAGAGEAEEQRALAVLADVGRAVHRHDVLRRQIEVERGEHRLLHLAGIGRAADQHDLAGEIDRHHRVGAFAAAVTLGIRLERRQVDDGQLRHEAGELLQLRTDQQLADEQRMPGIFGEDAHLDAIGGVGAAVEVLREQRLAFDVLDEVAEQNVEVLLRHLAIAVPPHRILRQVVDDGMLVLGRAAGVVSGEGRQRAAGDDRSFAVADGVFVERRFGEIPIHAGKAFEAEFIGAKCGIPHTSLLHARPPRNSKPRRRRRQSPLHRVARCHRL